MAKNPLFEPQRETAGSVTWEKYNYQYHWALFNVTSLYEEDKEFAVFMELHEDVVVADSLEEKNASFEFNQIKTTGVAFTENALIGKKKSKPTVLGKLVGSVVGKAYADRIKSINLVATNSFSLELKDANLNLEKITLNDLKEEQKRRIVDALKTELGITEVPNTINFIVPKLQEIGFQHAVIGKIAEMVSEKYPHSYCDAKQIYRLLIDELARKGMVNFDYPDWEDVLDKKSLTSRSFASVINSYTNLKDEQQINLLFNEICKELELKVLNRGKLTKSFNRYRLREIGSKNIAQLEISKAILKAIQAKMADIGDFKILLKEVSDCIDQNIKQMFETDVDLEAAVIYEYIINFHE